MRWMLAAWVVLYSAMALPASQALIPVEDFTRLVEVSNVQVSPDGGVLVFTAGKNGRSMLTCLSLGTDRAVRSFAVAPGTEITAAHWASPAHLVYVTQRVIFPELQPRGRAEMFSIDQRCENSRKIYGTQLSVVGRRPPDEATPRFLSTLRSDPDYVLVTEHPWRAVSGTTLYNSIAFNDPDSVPKLVRIHVRGGNRLSLGEVPLAGAKLLVDRDSAVRAAVGRRGSNVQLLWRANAEAAWKALVLPQIVAETIELHAFSAAGDHIFLTAVPSGTSHTALYRLDPTQSRLERMHGFDGMDVGRVLQDPRNGEVLGVEGALEPAPIHWLDEAHPAARMYQVLQRALPGQRLAIDSITTDGALAVVHASSDTNPGAYFLFDTKRKQADLLRAVRPWIDPGRMLPTRAVQLTARDGLKLHGYLTLPRSNGPSPMVVVPHDGPRARDTGSFDPKVQLLASRGYAVLQINYRGSSGYGLEFAAAGNGEWGMRMQDDLTDATRWAIDQGISQADRVCIFGSGYGGYAALTGVIREPQLYRCAVSLGGHYDLTSVVSQNDSTFDARRFYKQALGTDRPMLRALSPLYRAEEIRVPVLLIHGEQDFVASHEDAQRMAAALQQQAKSFELLALQGESHDIYQEPTRREVYVRILEFLAKHLQAPDALP